MKIKTEELNQVFRIYLKKYHIRNPHVVVEQDKDGNDVLIYPKNFSWNRLNLKLRH